MIERWRLSKSAFLAGVLTCGASICVLVVSVARVRPIQGYLEQADAAVPWVKTGTILAFLAFVLCFFGRGKARVAGLLFSFLLLSYWILVGMSLY